VGAGVQCGVEDGPDVIFPTKNTDPIKKEVANKYYSNFVAEGDIGAKRNNAFHGVMRDTN